MPFVIIRTRASGAYISIDGPRHLLKHMKHVCKQDEKNFDYKPFKLSWLHASDSYRGGIEGSLEGTNMSVRGVLNLIEECGWRLLSTHSHSESGAEYVFVEEEAKTKNDNILGDSNGEKNAQLQQKVQQLLQTLQSKQLHPQHDPSGKELQELLQVLQVVLQPQQRQNDKKKKKRESANTSHRILPINNDLGHDKDAQHSATPNNNKTDEQPINRTNTSLVFCPDAKYRQKDVQKTCDSSNKKGADFPIITSNGDLSECFRNRQT